ncbi:MAG: AI-2E family transporter [Wenzhouxiangella sp.]
MSAETETRLFGAVERRLFRAVAVMAAIVTLVGLIACMLWLLGKTLAVFYNLMMPLALTGILALVLYPVVDYLESRAKLPRVAAAGLIVLFFLAIFAAVIIMLAPTLSRQVGQLTEHLPAIIARWTDYLNFHFPGITRILTESAQDGEIKEMLPDMKSTGRTIKSYLGILVGLSLVPLLLFFALLSGGRLREQGKSALTIFSPRTQKNTVYFVDVFLGQVTGFFQGQLVIAIIMGILFSVGFTLIDLKGGILIGLILGLLNIVPFLGTLTGLLIVLPLAYLQESGGLQLLGLALVVFTVVQVLESWLLTPKIMANRSGLHPALVVIAIFFWGIALGGITGMILAVPLTAFLVAVWRQAKESVTRSMKSDHDADRITVVSDPA